MANLKSFYNANLDRNFPGTIELQETVDSLATNPMGKLMVIKELRSLWLIMDSRSSSMVCCKYRRLYGDTLRQLGAKPPRAATVSARPITREEFEAVTGAEEA